MTMDSDEARTRLLRARRMECVHSIAQSPGLPPMLCCLESYYTTSTSPGHMQPVRICRASDLCCPAHHSSPSIARAMAQSLLILQGVHQAKMNSKPIRLHTCMHAVRIPREEIRNLKEDHDSP